MLLAADLGVDLPYLPEVGQTFSGGELHKKKNRIFLPQNGRFRDIKTLVYSEYYVEYCFYLEHSPRGFLGVL